MQFSVNDPSLVRIEVHRIAFAFVYVLITLFSGFIFAFPGPILFSANEVTRRYGLGLLRHGHEFGICMHFCQSWFQSALHHSLKISGPTYVIIVVGMPGMYIYCCREPPVTMFFVPYSDINDYQLASFWPLIYHNLHYQHHDSSNTPTRQCLCR